jgi:hypothetical protein
LISLFSKPAKNIWRPLTHAIAVIDKAGMIEQSCRPRNR